MSKTQIWIVAAAVGVVALIAGVKHFSASPNENEAGAPRLAQREGKGEPGGWSVRSKSQDIATSDDVKVQRQVEAKPAGIAPPRRGLPAQPQGGQPAGGSGDVEQPAQPDSAGGEGKQPHTTSVGRPPDSAAAAGGGQVTGGDTQGSPPVADAGANVPGGAGPAGASGSDGAANPAANTQAGGNQPPAQEQQAQATPPVPEVVAVGAMYDSKDESFAIESPTEVKDIGNIPGHGVTMMMNLAPDWTPDSQDDADFLKLGDNLTLNKNVNYLRLEYTDPSGKLINSIGTNIKNWEGIEPPYSIAASVNGNQMALVVNGKVVARGNWEGAPYEAPPNPTLQIGCVNYPASRPCAAGGASGVMVLPPASPAELIERTKPANTKR